MKPFLFDLAQSIYQQHGRKLDKVTLVFPNRRAVLYFRKHLSSLLERPSFSPLLLTIEDFVLSFTNANIPDKLQLIKRLHAVYREVMQEESPAYEDEPFDQFYFWGEMLLRDFDEADKYLVNPEHLFKDLSHQKELDVTFDYLTPDQREFLEGFWINFDERDSANKRRFLDVWHQLPKVYERFRSALEGQGLAYEGLAYRQVAKDLLEKKIDVKKYVQGEAALVFAGFNALTKAEERVISFFVDQYDASVFWDVDDYYVNNERQEAARFFREYRQHPSLGRTFPHDPPANFKSPKQVYLAGAAQPIGQAKLLAQILESRLANGMNPEETLIVLPDEKLLMPVLHGVSDKVDKLNVTMGFPLSSTPLFNLVELLVELQLSWKDTFFNHRPVVTLLGHPYIVAADPALAQSKRKEILQQNWVSVSETFLRSQNELHRYLFVPMQDASSSALTITSYLKTVIQQIGELSAVSEFDKEYCFHFIKLLTRMEDVLYPGPSATGSADKHRLRDQLKSFLRLFRQLIRAEKIPFTGEPLRGLQVMGVLETRNLDFKHVFILSLNEGAFPSFSSKGSYIPYNIRKAYGLPTVEQQDSMYAYLFYRAVQRADEVYLFYNTETDDLGQGEMSRYLQQLLYESAFKIDKVVLHNEMQPLASGSLVVKKDERVVNELANYCTNSRTGKALSPSALNEYLECRLKFYFKYVARIREPREVEEDLDARVLGNFLHKVMELFYLDVIEKKGNTLIEERDFLGVENVIDGLIDKAFINNYGLNPEKKVIYEGQRLVVREIVRRFVDQILLLDKKYTPFTIEALERRDLTYKVPLNIEGNPTVVLGGSIDRADKKGDTVRIIDYKTGKDSITFAEVSALFDREGDKKNKAAFQTLLYTLIYKRNLTISNHLKFVPGLMNRVNLFNSDFTFGLQQHGENLQDATPLLDEFEAGLKKILEEIFNLAVPFDQTTDIKVCQFCPYREICDR